MASVTNVRTIEIDLLRDPERTGSSIRIDGEDIAGHVGRLDLVADHRGAYLDLRVHGAGGSRVSVRFDGGAVVITGRLDEATYRLLRALVEPECDEADGEQSGEEQDTT